MLHSAVVLGRVAEKLALDVRGGAKRDSEGYIARPLLALRIQVPSLLKRRPRLGVRQIRIGHDVPNAPFALQPSSGQRVSASSRQRTVRDTSALPSPLQGAGIFPCRTSSPRPFTVTASHSPSASSRSGSPGRSWSSTTGSESRGSRHRSLAHGGTGHGLKASTGSRSMAEARRRHPAPSRRRFRHGGDANDGPRRYSDLGQVPRHRRRAPAGRGDADGSAARGRATVTQSVTRNGGEGGRNRLRTGADDGIRTRDPHLGKAIPYVPACPGSYWCALSTLVSTTKEERPGHCRTRQDGSTAT
jgi:hypothetical protein